MYDLDLYVGYVSRSFATLDRLPDLYGLKYDSATACGLPLYLCSYKLVGSVTNTPTNFICMHVCKLETKLFEHTYRSYHYQVGFMVLIQILT